MRTVFAESRVDFSSVACVTIDWVTNAPVNLTRNTVISIPRHDCGSSRCAIVEDWCAKYSERLIKLRVRRLSEVR
jgi:hypothetical protein